MKIFYLALLFLFLLGCTGSKQDEERFPGGIGERGDWNRTGMGPWNRTGIGWNYSEMGFNLTEVSEIFENSNKEEITEYCREKIPQCMRYCRENPGNDICKEMIGGRRIESRQMP